MLDKNEYEVLNFGKGGSSAEKRGDHPYKDWPEHFYEHAIESAPDVVIIMLGTNDAKDFVWKREDYISEYQAFIQTFKQLASDPWIYVMIPPPLFDNTTPKCTHI